MLVWLISNPEKISKKAQNHIIVVDNKIAAKSVNLPDPFHNDPVDRMIIATAREYGAMLISSDVKIRNYPHVQTIW